MSMTNFWREYKSRIVGGSLGALLHLFIVALVEFVGGEGLGFILLLIDFPIVLLWNFVIGPVGLGGSAFVLTCYFGGTFIYALVGCFAGALLERFFPHYPPPSSL